MSGPARTPDQPHPKPTNRNSKDPGEAHRHKRGLGGPAHPRSPDRIPLTAIAKIRVTAPPPQARPGCTRAPAQPKPIHRNSKDPGETARTRGHAQTSATATSGACAPPTATAKIWAKSRARAAPPGHPQPRTAGAERSRAPAQPRRGPCCSPDQPSGFSDVAGVAKQRL